MPSVLGENYVTAENQLQNLGLKVTVTQGNDTNNPPVNAGDVYQQSVNGTTVPKGTAITLYYQQAAPTATPTTTAPTTTPPTSQSPSTNPSSTATATTNPSGPPPSN